MFYELIDDLIYNPMLLDYIQNNISLLGIVDSYFKIHGKIWSFKKEAYTMKIRYNKKFVYDCCPYHRNNPNLFAFSINEDKGLYYCFGCGARGSVFEFINEVYGLDLNETTELLGSLLGVFNSNMLNKNLKIIYDELKIYYGNQDYLIDESERKTKYLNDRIERYFQKIDMEDINYKKIADRLCCSEELIINKYAKSEYNKQKTLTNESNYYDDEIKFN